MLHEKEVHFNLAVHNTNQKLPFHFTTALNIFLRVQDVTKFEMCGIGGCAYIDRIDDAEIKRLDDNLKIKEYTDYLILDTPNEFYVSNNTLEQKFRVQKQMFSDISIWNPWKYQVLAIEDMSDDEYLKFFYFATGNISKFIKLEPGGVFEAKVVLCNCTPVSVNI